jgi:hypothetical protein
MDNCWFFTDGEFGVLFVLLTNYFCVLQCKHEQTELNLVSPNFFKRLFLANEVIFLMRLFGKRLFIEVQTSK